MDKVDIVELLSQVYQRAKTDMDVRHFFARRHVPTINGRDKSGPYNTGNKLPFLIKKQYMWKRDDFLTADVSCERPLDAHVA